MIFAYVLTVRKSAGFEIVREIGIYGTVCNKRW